MKPAPLIRMLVSLGAGAMPASAWGQNLIQHWKLDEAVLVGSGGSPALAPLANEVAGGAAAFAQAAAITDFNPGQPGALATSGTAIAIVSKYARFNARIPDEQLGTQPFTLALWFNCTTKQAGIDVVASSDIGAALTPTGWTLELTGAAGATALGLGFRHRGWGGSGAADPDYLNVAGALTAGTWNHFALTRDAANNLTLYLNGVALWARTDAAAFDVDLTDPNKGVWFGRRPDFGETGTVGLFDDIRLYDDALSAAAVSALAGDSDLDGLPDNWELEWFPDLAQGPDDDPDDDGFTNHQEFLVGTDPTDELDFPGDSDGDDLEDLWEIVHFGDLDEDGFGDPDGDDALNREEHDASRGLAIARDGSGAITGVTPFSGSSDPTDADSQPDEDDDGLPDGWEFASFFDLSEGPGDDYDGDTHDNQTEFLAGSDPVNELSTPTDIDADGMEDAWERTFFGGTGRDGTGDFDNDGSPDLAEFEGGSNPADFDSQPDSDLDGLRDGDEASYFGDLDRDGSLDFDGDGFSDAAELAAGSNPARPANTPDNVNDTVSVAVATTAGIDEYSVTNDTWSRVRQIAPGEFFTLLWSGADALFYAATTDAIVSVAPADGSVTVLATRNTGDALAAGWTSAVARGLEFGPDGRLYFATAFGTAAGEGVFRLNTDGTGFQQFIPRTGTGYELNNAIDISWHGGALYATSRGPFGATNRPVYQFDAAGALVATVAATLTGPQGLLADGDTLWVTGTNDASALVSLDLGGAFPVAPETVRRYRITNPEAIDILGEVHVVNYGYQATNGSIAKDDFRPALTPVLADVGTGAYANDAAVFTSTATPYETWARGYGIDPAAPGGAPADDYEGDGSSNQTEFVLGLDPTDGASRFAAGQSGTPAAGLTLTWPSQPGLTFTVRSSTDLSDWSTVEATVPAAAAPAASTSWTSGPLAGPRRFFRIEFTP